MPKSEIIPNFLALIHLTSIHSVMKIEFKLIWPFPAWSLCYSANLPSAGVTFTHPIYLQGSDAKALSHQHVTPTFSDLFLSFGCFSLSVLYDTILTYLPT